MSTPPALALHVTRMIRFVSSAEIIPTAVAVQ
jgi:hypothetical protein